MEFENVLKSRQHNKHYLDRYIKFINYYKNINQSGLLEKHHICPKARDFWPEYKNFKDTPWNKIELTRKQHRLAHILLWKSFGGRSIHAVVYMWGDKNISESVLIQHRKHLSISMSEYNKKGKFKWVTNKETLISIRVPIEDIEKYLNNNYFLGVKNSKNFKVNRCDNKGRKRLYDTEKQKIVALSIEQYDKYNKKYLCKIKNKVKSKPTTKDKVVISKDGDRKFINPKELEKYLNDGWKKGIFDQKPTTLNRICVHIQNKQKYINPKELEKYLNDGWKKGAKPKRRPLLMIKGDTIKKVYNESIQKHLESGWTFKNKRNKFKYEE